MTEKFAEKLRAIRTEAKWSRPKMVECMGIPLRTIEDWEAGKSTPPEYVQRLVLDRLDLEIQLDAFAEGNEFLEDYIANHKEKCLCDMRRLQEQRKRLQEERMKAVQSRRYLKNKHIPEKEEAVKMKKYKVELNSIGNPDRGQDPTQQLYGAWANMAHVDSIEEAQKAVRDYIEEHNLGAGNWAGGKVWTSENKYIGYISYNGRFWEE